MNAKMETKLVVNPWPNGFGWDVNDFEVTDCGDDGLKVTYPINIPSVVVATADPVYAVHEAYGQYLTDEADKRMVQEEDRAARQAEVARQDEPKHVAAMLLPPNLSALSKVCAKESARYAMTGVRLTSTNRGYRAEATNGKQAAVVVGPCDSMEDYPDLQAVSAAPNSGTSAVIPAKAWSEAFKLAPKRACKPILSNVAAVLSENQTTFAATNLEGEQSAYTRNVEGRFPDVKSVIPGGKVAEVRVNAKLLADLLKVASEYADNGVTLEIHTAGAPVVLRAKNGNGQEFTGLMMPLS